MVEALKEEELEEERHNPQLEEEGVVEEDGHNRSSLVLVEEEVEVDVEVTQAPWEAHNQVTEQLVEDEVVE